VTAGAAAERTAPKGRVLSGDFLRFWLIQLCAQVSAKVALLFLPILAVSSYQVTPAVLGFLNALQYAPVLAVALVFGAAFDRWDRRTGWSPPTGGWSSSTRCAWSARPARPASSTTAPATPRAWSW
jgi:hypothetical protein